MIVKGVVKTEKAVNLASFRKTISFIVDSRSNKTEIKSEIEKNMLAYCKRDTEAMVGILSRLHLLLEIPNDSHNIRSRTAENNTQYSL